MEINNQSTVIDGQCTEPTLGSTRAGDSAHVRLVTAWDGHTTPAESGAQHSCIVRVIKALDYGSGQYIVKEGVSCQACGVRGVGVRQRGVGTCCHIAQRGTAEFCWAVLSGACSKGRVASPLKET